MPAAEIDDFMNALAGLESGHNPNAVNRRTGAHGTFQIMPSNWTPWAQEAGLPGDAPKTPENQHRVARSKMLDYYNQFGRWDAVAVAWFAGPGRARRYVDGDASVLELSDGNLKVSQYVDRVTQGLNSARSGGSTGPGGGVTPTTERGTGRPPQPGGEPEAGSTPASPEATLQQREFWEAVRASNVGGSDVMPSGRRKTAEARDQAGGPETDSRTLLTGALQSISDQISGRSGVGTMFPSMGGPEPARVPSEQLPDEVDALDGLGEQGDITAVGEGSTPTRPGGGQQERQTVGGQPRTPRGEDSPGDWVMPTAGRWSSNFGQNRGTHKHGGVDISAPEGTVIRAARPGTVSRSGRSDSYGYVVYIDHPGGAQTRYAHMVGMPPVNVGDQVQGGQPIGNVGNTGDSEGNHLHFEIRVDGKATDPSQRYGIDQRFQEVA